MLCHFLIKPHLAPMWLRSCSATSSPHPISPRSIFVNLEIVERVYSKKGEHMCPNDGYVCFRNSELVCGRLGKVRAAAGSVRTHSWVILSWSHRPPFDHHCVAG